MTKLEREVEAALVRKVKDAGGYCLKWTCPGWTGVPDRLVLLPHGRIIFVELKRPKGGKFSPMQEWWARTLRELGFSYWTVYDEHSLYCFTLTELKK